MKESNPIKKFLYQKSKGYSFLPTYFAVNIANLCTRECSFCPYYSPMPDNYHSRWYRKQPYHINISELINFFDTVPKFMLKSVAVTGKGEPLLHKRIFTLLDYLEKRGVPFSITSNGDQITQEIMDRIMAYKNCSIRISLYDQEQLDKWIYNDVFGVKDRIGFFNMTGEHVEGLTDGYISANFGVEHERVMTDFNITDFCKAPFSFLTINTDGGIVPCYSYHDVGHISQGFWGVFNNKKLRAYRNTAVNGRQCTFADCNNCGINEQ